MAMENINLWVYKQCAKHTPSRGSGSIPHRKILKNKLNLEAILANNFMLLSSLTYEKCSIIHVIKALNLRIDLYSK